MGKMTNKLNLTRKGLGALLAAAITTSLLSTVATLPAYANHFIQSGAIAGTTVTHMKVTSGSGQAHVGDTITTIVGERVRPYISGDPIPHGPPCFGAEGNCEQIFPSALTGKQINEITIRLSKVGSPTGTATIGVFDGSSGAVKAGFGTKSVSTLTTTPSDYTFTLGSFYTLVANDRIGIIYSGGTTTSYVAVQLSDTENAFDWASSTVSSFSASTGTWDTGQDRPDIVMTLRHVETTTQMNVATGANSNTLYSSYSIIGEAFKSSSAVVNKPVDQVTLTLAKVGTPTGTATIGVFDSTGSIKYTFGTKDVSSLTTSSTAYVFKSSNAYLVAAGDYIGIKYTGGSSSSYVKVTQSNAEAFDGNNSVLSWFVASSNAWCDCYGDLTMKLELTEVHFKGNELQNTGSSITSKVWAAMSTGEIASYPVTDASVITRYPVGGDPTYMALTGPSLTQLAFTEPNANKVCILDTSTGALIQNVAPPAGWQPFDITTSYNGTEQQAGVVFFTSLNTPNWGEIQTQTGTFTSHAVPSGTAQLKGIAAVFSDNYGSNVVLLTDIFNKVIWRYDRTTGSYTSTPMPPTLGTPDFLALDYTNGNIWGTAQDYNQIYGLDERLVGQFQPKSADPEPFYVGAVGPDRIKIATTDVLVTYPQSNFIVAIHVINLNGDNGHRGTVQGVAPFDVVSDPISTFYQDGNWNWQATYSGSNIVVRGSQFPI